MKAVHPLLLACVLAWHTTATAADLLREQRIREHLEQSTAPGEAITLQTADLEFLALLAGAETPEKQGAVILLHDHGANPDWRQVIHPLRTALPAHGWETLSIQLPVPAVDALADSRAATLEKAYPRIAFAVDFLAQRNTANIAIVGHGQGARAALQWLAEGIPDGVRACVAIGLAAQRPETGPGTLNALSRIELPILDVYGSRDRGDVVDSAKRRAAAAREAGNDAYRQLRIAGADHDFTGFEDRLANRIRAWLSRVAGGTEVDAE